MVPLLIMATSLVSKINTSVALLKGWVNSFLAFMGQLYLGFYTPQELVKNMCLLDREGRLITAIVKGEDRVSVSRIAKMLQREGLRLATPAEILETTGY